MIQKKSKCQMPLFMSAVLGVMINTVGTNNTLNMPTPTTVHKHAMVRATILVLHINKYSNIRLFNESISSLMTKKMLKH